MAPRGLCAHTAGVNRADLRRASYPGLEIIAELAAVLEVEPAELLRVPASKGEREPWGCRPTALG